MSSHHWLASSNASCPKLKNWKNLPLPKHWKQAHSVLIGCACHRATLTRQVATKQDLPVTEDNMLKAYRAVNDADARLHQLEQLQRVCERIDKYVNSFMLQNALLAKGQAYKYNYRVVVLLPMDFRQ